VGEGDNSGFRCGPQPASRPPSDLKLSTHGSNTCCRSPSHGGTAFAKILHVVGYPEGPSLSLSAHSSDTWFSVPAGKWRFPSCAFPPSSAFLPAPLPPAFACWFASAGFGNAAGSSTAGPSSFSGFSCGSLFGPSAAFFRAAATDLALSAPPGPHLGATIVVLAFFLGGGQAQLYSVGPTGCGAS